MKIVQANQDHHKKLQELIAFERKLWGDDNFNEFECGVLYLADAKFSMKTGDKKFVEDHKADIYGFTVVNSVGDIADRFIRIGKKYSDSCTVYFFANTETEELIVFAAEDDSSLLQRFTEIKKQIALEYCEARVSGKVK